MKDLRFTGTVSSVAVDVTFRTDLIGSDGNFSVIQVMYGSSFSSNRDATQDKIVGKFDKLPYNLADFKKFATDNSLTLTSADSNGANLTTLV